MRPTPILSAVALALSLVGGVACTSADTGTTSSSSGGSSSGAGAASACLPDGATLNVTASDATAYVIGGEFNPDFTLCRGRTYTFAVNAPGHPFFIKTAAVVGTASAFDEGVTNNGAESGDVVFAVPAAAPATLHYICGVHAVMTGQLTIVDAP